MDNANDNLIIYNKARAVPSEAKKQITAGRLKNFTDINPMWRIKKLTEIFGPVGKGWYYDILEERIEEGSENQKVAFMRINLYVKYDGEWSKPITGAGGNSFIAKEKNGLYTNDECFKMALSDALSVSMKALGIGADVYYEKDRTKYNGDNEGNGAPPPNNKQGNNGKAEKPLSEAQINRLYTIANKAGVDTEKVKEQVKTKFNKEVTALTKAEYDQVCKGYEGLKK